MSTPEPASTAFTPQERAEFMKIFGSMSYAGPLFPLRVETAADLVANLHRLSKILGNAAHKASQRDVELSQMKRDIAGMRRIFGLPLEEEPE